MIKKIYGKHIFYFTLFTVVLSATTLVTKNIFSFTKETITLFICLFLILSIGISHGALDNYKANKLLKIYRIKNKAIFFYNLYIYLCISNFCLEFIWHFHFASLFACCFLSLWTRGHFIFTQRKLFLRSNFLFN